MPKWHNFAHSSEPTQVQENIENDCNCACGSGGLLSKTTGSAAWVEPARTMCIKMNTVLTFGTYSEPMGRALKW